MPEPPEPSQQILCNQGRGTAQVSENSKAKSSEPTAEPMKILKKRGRDQNDDPKRGTWLHTLLHTVVELVCRRSDHPIRCTLEKPGKKSKSGMKEALEDVGVSIGPKTTRERLLGLLEQRVRQKKQRRTPQLGPSRDSKTPAKRSKPGSQLVKQTSSSTATEPNSTIVKAQADYSKFEDSFLASLLHAVGLDCTGMDREWLVQNCRIYDELSKSCCFSMFFWRIEVVVNHRCFPPVVLPAPNPTIGPVASQSKDAQMKIDAPKADFSFTANRSGTAQATGRVLAINYKTGSLE